MAPREGNGPEKHESKDRERSGDVDGLRVREGEVA